MHNPFSLTGRTALITGGNSGIGAAIARSFAAAGARVAITVHRPTDNIDGGPNAPLAFRAELGDSQAIEPLLAQVERALGPLDILVNCAGTIRRADAAQYDDKDWSAVMAVNLDAVWRLSQAAGRAMLQRGGGKIINIASLLGLQGGVRVPAYAASKHAVVGVTKALANEWAARQVNVNCIAPGYIETANTAALRADPDRSRQILERIPAGRWGQPDDIGAAAVFLASDAARYVHGHTLVVDGGWMGR
jgi:2-dehydro-3-deoxy-D-gluconate 5-dehydrogenase